MSREDFIAVASRLFSIYVLFLTIRSTPTALQMLDQADGMAWVALYALVLVLCLIFASFLWFFPLTVARKLLPVMREPRSETAIDSSIALSLGITLIGIWFLANSIADASYWLVLIIRTKQAHVPEFEWTSDQVAGMAATIVELFLAFSLLLGTSGIKRLIFRFRYGEIADAR